MDENSKDIRKNKLPGLLRICLYLIVLAGIVWLVRFFCFQSYRVSTDSMERTLHPGDFIVVNKLPLPDNPSRNQVVLFSSPLLQDSLTKPLFLSRCIGMPGDTIRITEDGYIANGTFIPYSPRTLSTYFITHSARNEVFQALRQLAIPVRNQQTNPEGFSIHLTGFEEFQLREALSSFANKGFTKEKITPYSLIVPRKERAYRLDETALIACKEAILSQAGDNARFRDGKLFLDGKETSFFFFEQDHYWMLSDNIHEAIDSRHLGFIPARNIIGTACFRWYSKDKKQVFKPIH
ncbi:MAG: signal peptidase I [Tannerellaceae bacterium]|nr:signal peptidase I [Tannerellaceae bacterium]